MNCPKLESIKILQDKEYDTTKFLVLGDHNIIATGDDKNLTIYAGCKNTRGVLNLAWGKKLIIHISAFEGCTGLVDATNVIGDKSIAIEIKSRAFYGCTSLVRGNDVAAYMLDIIPLASSFFWSLFKSSRSLYVPLKPPGTRTLPP